MKQMLCPLNGLRNISEFTYGGEVEAMPDPNVVGTKEWSKYIFYHENQIGVVKEWWCHTTTSYWFITERHTQSDEILKTYDPSEIFKNRIEFS